MHGKISTDYTIFQRFCALKMSVPRGARERATRRNERVAAFQANCDAVDSSTADQGININTL